MSSQETRSAHRFVNERNVWLTVPNVLTALRLGAIVPFAFLASEGRDLEALALFFVAGLTDTLDGTIARRFGQESKIGRLLDPLADKLFTCISFVVLSVFRTGLPSIPMWITIPVILRDFLILSGSFLVYRVSRNSGFKPSVYGKLNTLFEVGLVMIFLAQTSIPFITRILLPCYVILLVSLVVSAGDYLRTGLRMTREPVAAGGR
jgi:cardiolipin synthase